MGQYSEIVGKLDVFFQICSNDIYLYNEQRSINDILTILFDNLWPSFSELHKFLFIGKKLNKIQLNSTLYHARSFTESERKKKRSVTP